MITLKDIEVLLFVPLLKRFCLSLIEIDLLRALWQFQPCWKLEMHEKQMIEYWRGEIDRESAILLLTEVPENNVEFSLIRSYKIRYHLLHCSLRNEY